MPYIDQRSRQPLEKHITWLAKRIHRPGVLNYIVTRIVLAFVNDREANYDSYNAAIGALECAKLELYRRRVALYEDEKIEQNGDVV